MRPKFRIFVGMCVSVCMCKHTPLCCLPAFVGLPKGQVIVSAVKLWFSVVEIRKSLLLIWLSSVLHPYNIDGPDLSQVRVFGDRVAYFEGAMKKFTGLGVTLIFEPWPYSRFAFFRHGYLPGP